MYLKGHLSSLEVVLIILSYLYTVWTNIHFKYEVKMIFFKEQVLFKMTRNIGIEKSFFENNNFFMRLARSLKTRSASHIYILVIFPCQKSIQNQQKQISIPSILGIFHGTIHMLRCFITFTHGFFPLFQKKKRKRKTALRRIYKNKLCMHYFRLSFCKFI